MGRISIGKDGDLALYAEGKSRTQGMEIGKHRECLQGTGFGMELKKMTKLILMLLL